jgi:cytochrome o ubiquinol oxidase operon protein cyoD
MNRRDISRAVAGFVLSTILTLTAYSLVVNGILHDWTLAYAIIGLALLQLIVQLLFFLHLGRENEPRWNLLAFDFTLVVVVIIVIGSIWIMNNLHYNMTPQEVDQELLVEEGIRQEP